MGPVGAMAMNPGWKMDELESVVVCILAVAIMGELLVKSANHEARYNV